MGVWGLGFRVWRFGSLGFGGLGIWGVWGFMEISSVLGTTSGVLRGSICVALGMSRVSGFVFKVVSPFKDFRVFGG